MPDFHATPDKNSPSSKSQTVAALQGNKKVKSEVNYRVGNNEAKICHTCTSYENPSADKSPCRKVIGIVESSATCDLWASGNEQTPPSQDPNAGSHHLSIRIHTGLNSSTLSRILTENPEG